ncbi:hypothetical protein INR49_015901 [Caranx melampygus]|nr:hypothetical protein INR49_015901 [Caranx melampygus]
MASQGLQIIGILLACIGWLGTIITCATPMWKVTAYIGGNIVTSQVIWEGLWMNCVKQSTGQMQCKVYNPLLALPSELQAARTMVVIAVIAGVFGVLMAVVGGNDLLLTGTDSRGEHRRSAAALMRPSLRGALPPNHREQQAKQREQDGNDHHGPGRLEVWGQGQQGVVHLALHLACALHHTGHPQSFPDGLSHYNVVPNESRHLPQGQHTDEYVSYPSEHCQSNAKNLQA